MNQFIPFMSQDQGSPIYKHKEFPVYLADQFNFYRCLEFRDDFYGKTASCLFNGNLRMSTGRYAKLFPGQKISYWSDNPQTARAEIKRHGAGNNILTFWAYDDVTSTLPILQNREPLVIIDGRKCGVQALIDKADKDIALTEEEQVYLKALLATQPDCLVYDSHARKGGENYIFFEKGFQKLALRELSLRFSRQEGGSHKTIACAGASDYLPFIEAYGCFFLPKARIAMDSSYLNSDEFLSRKEVYNNSLSKLREAKA